MSPKRCKKGSYNDGLIGSRIRAFDWYQNQWPWMSGWPWTAETFCPSVSFRYRDHICWNTSKINSQLISWRFMLRLTPTWAIWCNGTTPKLWWNRGGDMSAKNCNISETVQDRVIRSPSSAFQWSQNAWPWMTSKRDSRCFVLALAPDAPHVDKVAVFNIHKRFVIDLL